MEIYHDKETDKIKRLYTGREIMIALGVKLNIIHEVYKNHYKDLYDLFDERYKNSMDKIPLFENELEFYNCLLEGNESLIKKNEIKKNPIYKKTKNHFKIKRYSDIKKYDEVIITSTRQIIIQTILHYIFWIGVGVCIGKFIIG